MNGPKNGSADAPCCGGPDLPAHSAATCPCDCHRPDAALAEEARLQAEDDAQSIRTVDLRQGFMLVHFNESGCVDTVTLDSEFSTTAHFSEAAHYLRTMADIRMQHRCLTHLKAEQDQRAAGVQGAAPGGSRGAKRRLHRVRQ